MDVPKFVEPNAGVVEGVVVDPKAGCPNVVEPKVFVAPVPNPVPNILML